MSEAAKVRLGWWMAFSGVILVVLAAVLGQAIVVIRWGLVWPESLYAYLMMLGGDVTAVTVGSLWYTRVHARREHRRMLALGQAMAEGLSQGIAGSMSSYGMDTARQQADERDGR